MHLEVAGVIHPKSKLELLAATKRPGGKADIEEQQSGLESAFADIRDIAENITRPIPQVVGQVGTEHQPGFERLAVVSYHNLAREVTNAQKGRLGHIEPGLSQLGILWR